MLATVGLLVGVVWREWLGSHRSGPHACQFRADRLRAGRDEMIANRGNAAGESGARAIHRRWNADFLDLADLRCRDGVSNYW